jgi:hypothetical protein
MNKMTVVSFESTGHVLGVATRSTQPDKALTVEEVAAGGILVRGGANAELQALIDKDQLKTSLVDYDTSLVYRPYLFAVTADLAIEPQDAVAPVSVALSGSIATVNMPAPASEIEVYLHLSAGGLAEPAVRAVTVAAGAASGSIPLVLAFGTYTVVILAPGYATRIVTEPVP